MNEKISDLPNYLGFLEPETTNPFYLPCKGDIDIDPIRHRAYVFLRALRRKGVNVPLCLWVYHGNGPIKTWPVKNFVETNFNTTVGQLARLLVMDINTAMTWLNEHGLEVELNN